MTKLTLLLLGVSMPAVVGMCDSYCAHPCSQFAHPADTVDECSDCTDDGSSKCFPGAAGYGDQDAAADAAPVADAAPPAEAAAPAGGGSLATAKAYEGIDVLGFDALKDDKRMKMVIFHWAGEKGSNGLVGDELVATMQTLKKMPGHEAYLWFHVDVPADAAAVAEFKQENLPMTFSQTPEDGISHFNGGDFTVENFEKWHAFRTGTGWKDGHKVVRLEADDLPGKLEEMAKEKPVFLKMYEEWCHHCKSLKPHFQRSSNEVPDVHFVEVECAKSGGFCGHFFPGNGYPRMRFLNKGGNKAHDYKGLTYDKMTTFAKDPSKWEFKVDTGFGVEIKEEL